MPDRYQDQRTQTTRAGHRLPSGKPLKSTLARMHTPRAKLVPKIQIAIKSTDPHQWKISDYIPMVNQHVHLQRDANPLSPPFLPPSPIKTAEHSLSQSNQTQNSLPTALLPLGPTMWGHSLEAIDTTKQNHSSAPSKPKWHSPISRQSYPAT